MLREHIGYWKGKHLSKRHRKKISEAHRGKHLSKRHRKKISEVHRGKHHSEETKKKISEGHKGVKFSDEHRRNISISRKGVRFSDEHLRNMSKCRQGSKHWNWKGGISCESYSVDWTETLRRSIRERDHYVCQWCSNEGNEVHHIDYNKENCDPRNLITLCFSCHRKTNYNRKIWIILLRKKCHRI